MKDRQPSGGVDPKAGLTEEQYRITQLCGTEPAFHNEYWDNHRAGIYVDVVSGKPLFSSMDKYDSGSGWPSFMKPLEPGALREREDRSFGMERVAIALFKHHGMDPDKWPAGVRKVLWG